MRMRDFVARAFVAVVAVFAVAAHGRADVASSSPPVVQFADHDPDVGSVSSGNQIDFAIQPHYANQAPSAEFTSFGGDSGKGGDCGSCGPRRILIGGAEATFLFADVNGSPATIGTFNVVNTQVGAYSSAVTEVDQLYTAPRVWLGVQGDQWGLVGRFWDYRASNTFFDPLLLGGDNLGLASNSNLRAYTMDLEATRTYCWRGWNGNLALGVRHATLDTITRITAAEVIAISEINAFAISDRQFNGTGLTYGLTGSRAISCDSALSLFWNARGSVLWGTNTAAANAGSQIIRVLNTSNVDSDTSVNTSSDLIIFEGQAGVQWEHELKCMPASAFFKVAGEYQYWDASNDVSATASAPTNLVLGASAAANATAGAQQVDFFGFTIGAGFMR